MKSISTVVVPTADVLREPLSVKVPIFCQYVFSALQTWICVKIMRHNWLVLPLKWAPRKEKGNTTQSNHTSMINGGFKIGCSGIYFISRGESAASIIVLCGSPLTCHHFDCAALSLTLDASTTLIRWLDGIKEEKNTYMQLVGRWLGEIRIALINSN